MDKITVFLDRDGVINKKAPLHEYISRWEDFQFLDGAENAVRELCEAGVRVIVVTNQRGIARGKISANAVNEINEKMCEALAAKGAKISAVYVCPHNTGECRCRKPNIGMFEAAEKDFCICRNSSWTVGDSLSDILAGMRFGTKTVYIGGRGDCPLADYTSESLADACRLILKEIGEN